MSDGVSKNSGENMTTFKISDPSQAINLMDAVLLHVERHYKGDELVNNIPNLRKTIVKYSIVVFEDVPTFRIRKLVENDFLELVHPAVDEEQENAIAEELQNKHSQLIIRHQREAFELLRSMVTCLLDDEGITFLLKQLEEHKKNSKENENP